MVFQPPCDDVDHAVRLVDVGDRHLGGATGFVDDVERTALDLGGQRLARAGQAPQPPPPASRLRGRNGDWRHLFSRDVLSMPDTWEYPWFAAWDLAFHCLPLALVDADFAKEQLPVHQYSF